MSRDHPPCPLHNNPLARYVDSRAQLLASYQTPASFFRILSASCAVAGALAAAGWFWSNRRINQNILLELQDIEELEEEEDGIDELDPSLDEPVTPGPAAGGGSLPCVVCFDRKRRVVCSPCRHFALCVDCARRTWDANRRCPCCRADLDGFSTVFLA
jgi:hypothetical protein